MKSLYALTEDQQRMEDAILSFIDTDEEFADSLFAYLGTIQDDVEEKIDRTVYVRRTLLDRAAAQKAAAADLKEQAGYAERKAKRIEDYLQNWLEGCGLTAHRGKLTSISIVKNGGLLPITWEGDRDRPGPGEMPERYVKETREIDMQVVREDLQAGVPVPFFVFGDRGTRLKVN